MTWRWKDILGVASVALFVLTAAIALVILCRPLYSWFAQNLGLAAKLGLSHDQLMENYHVLLDYLTLPWVEDLSMPDFPSSDSGFFHFWEVKLLFMLDFVVLALSLLGLIFYARDLKQTQHFRPLKQFFAVASCLPLALGLVLLIDFDWLFLHFHQVLFNNDDWIFDPRTDPIILALPQEFFALCFAVVFILVELAMVGGFLWTRSKLKALNR